VLDLANEFNITWTMLPPLMPANQILATSPHWKKAYSDDIAIIYVRVN
jgi:hypothetical protein